MLLKLREDNSNFLPARSSLFLWEIQEIKIQFYGSQLLENSIDIHLHVNEFIMPAVLQSYFLSTINRSTLSQIIQ